MNNNEVCIAGWDELAELLREEVAQYGRLFRHLEDQRAALIAQDPPAILELNVQLEKQAVVLNELQQRRGELVTALREDLGLSGEMGIIEMTQAALPENAPLIEERLREVNRLIRETRRYLSSSRVLYRKAWEIGQAVLAAAGFQQQSLSLYSQGGVASAPKAAAGSLTNQHA
ncbi:flagellar export chaperone FlgN [Ruficoccus amylovorans]|uniref:Flagellar export chaperone FlgN n=1 Tax=Ruficoccus amylovorans TaxID=1804625 RepID=A0A842HHE0_9BACT|nr:flagellar export chaperone FlgN [Ruficoccus amylovorans]MBC2595036.1 flagellar export chaperone FlgN [Ruficoccus amylovorans]